MRGYLEVDEFTKNISEMALDQITDANKNDHGKIWPAQWLLGLTGKSVQKRTS